MKDRSGEVWEATSHMNGERVFVVLESRRTVSRQVAEAMVHTTLMITGKKLGRKFEQTEVGGMEWDRQSTMRQLA
jgi:hypothetical protein